MAKKKPVRRKRTPKKRKVIEAKPTKYRGVLYASKLEARWAVFLDYYHLNAVFEYEPKTFTLEDRGWDYTPDFFFQWGNFPGYLEVKPDVPSKEYLEVLCTFAQVLPLQLALGFGSFFKGDVPKIWVPGLSPSVHKPTPVKVKAEALSLDIHWPDSALALKTAAEYRFDLDGQDPPPPFRNPGSGKNPLDHFEEFRKMQDAKHRPTRAALMEQRRKAMKEAQRKGKKK